MLERYPIKRSLRKVTASELRAKDVYVKKEVRTSDPARFLRNLAIGVGELGYTLDKDVEAAIKKGESLETSLLNIPLTAVKQAGGKEGRNIMLVAGIVVTGIGILLFIMGTNLGLLVMGIGELSVILWLQNRARTQAAKEKQPEAKMSRIWLLLESKERAAEPALYEESVPSGGRGRMSEFVVHAAGESGGDKVTLQSEIKTLTDRFDVFA